ncbi:MAG: hypothetical protein K0U66_01300 [Gammaproteobacteria bacterium]|nr:hypothetical protein [Gammaproteobacteria bacterium]
MKNVVTSLTIDIQLGRHNPTLTIRMSAKNARKVLAILATKGRRILFESR